MIRNSETGKVDIVSNRITNSTLPHDAYIAWDKDIKYLIKKKLTLFEHFRKYNLIDNSFTLGDILLKYERVSEMTDATVSLQGVTAGEADVLTFDSKGVPLPFIFKPFNLEQRHMEAAQRSGVSLPLVYQREAMSVVMQKLNTLLIDGDSTIKLGGEQIYGITNHPNRITYSIANDWGGGSETPYQDVLDMLQLAKDKFMYGPFALYISPKKFSFMLNTYVEAGAVVMPGYSYMSKFRELQDITEVAFLEGLADDEVVLVQMDNSTLDLAVAEQFMTLPTPKTDLFQYGFMSLCAMTPRIKLDKNNTVGIIHATGA